MKMTERIGPNLSGINHQGRRYTPKELVRKGLPSFHGGYLPLSHEEIAEMVKGFRAETGRDPVTLHHAGMMNSGQSICVLMLPGPAVWLKQQGGCDGNWLE
jgi:hypothetical protein